MPFTKYTYVAVPGLNIATVQQISIGNYVAGSGTQIYINRLDWPGHGFKTVAPMVISLDANNQVSDITNQVFPGGVPAIYWSPRVGLLDVNQDGYSDLYVADGGADTNPYPGSQNFMLLSNGGTNLTASLDGIPVYANALNHGFGIGDVSGNGSQSILAVGARYSYQAATQLLVNNGVNLVNSPALLPAFLSETGMTSSTYAWSGIVDLSGSGRGDLIFGQWDGSKTNSFVLLNNGSGDFSKAIPIDLPSSGVPWATVVQITPIDIFGRGMNDLVLSITTGGTNSYSYPYLQFLKNLGNGQFEDVTSTAFSQVKAKSTYFGDWNIFVSNVDLNCDGRSDLLVQSTSASSYYLINNGNGSFTKGGDFGVGAITTLYENGIPTIVSTDQPSPTNGKDDSPSTGLRIYQNDLHLGNKRYFFGSATNPNITGTAFNDVYTPGYGKEAFDGMSGINQVSLANASSDYALQISSSTSFHIGHLSNQNIDIMASNVQRVSFTDGTMALDIAPGQNAGEVYRLYQAAFARTPDMPGVKYHLNDMEANGLPLWQIASNFLASPEFATQYGQNPTDTQYINALYHNVLNRTPGQSEVDWYQNQFNTKAMDHQAALIGFSESPENVALVGSAIANGIWLG